MNFKEQLGQHSQYDKAKVWTVLDLNPTRVDKHKDDLCVQNCLQSYLNTDPLYQKVSEQQNTENKQNISIPHNCSINNFGNMQWNNKTDSLNQCSCKYNICGRRNFILVLQLDLACLTFTSITYQQMRIAVILFWNLVTPLVRTMNITSSFFRLDRLIVSA